MKSNRPASIIFRSPSHEQGAIAVYIALLMLFMITSGIIILSGILSRQVRFSQELIDSERAFYAANTGVEHAYYALAQHLSDSDREEDAVVIQEEGEVPYAVSNEDPAGYSFTASLMDIDGSLATCVLSEGEYGGLKRRVFIRPAPDIDSCE